MAFLKIIFILAVCLVPCFKAYSVAEFTDMECIYWPRYDSSESSSSKNGYHFRYSDDNLNRHYYEGQERVEDGVFLNPGTDNEERVVSGHYAYQSGLDGVYVVYRADKNGYRAHVYTRKFGLMCRIRPPPLYYSPPVNSKLCKSLCG